MEIPELHDPAAATVEQEPHNDQRRNPFTMTRLSQSSPRNLVAEQQNAAPLDEVIAIEVGRFLFVSLCMIQGKHRLTSISYRP